MGVDIQLVSIYYTWQQLLSYRTRQEFATACENAFGNEVVDYYACSKEAHANTQDISKMEYHYHVSIKLSKPQRWWVAKQYLSNLGAIVNFARSKVLPASQNASMYAHAYRYITKYDDNTYHSPMHPSLDRINKPTNSTKANAAFRVNQSHRRKSSSASPSATTSTAESAPASTAASAPVWFISWILCPKGEK